MIATSQFTISVIKDGKDGAPGATGPQGVSVEKVVKEYRLSDSSTEMTGSGDGYTWSETKPKIPSGKYLWEHERTDLSNNTSEYSTAHCDIVTSGLVLDVDRNTNAITSKVWESDITTKINEYDGSTGKSIRDRVTKTETDISGINTTISDIQTDVAGKADGSTVTTLTTKVNTISDTVDEHTQTIESNTSRIDDAEDEIESTKTIASQTADKFTWLVKDGTSASNFTLTSRVAELISPEVVIKDPAGSATIISGGKIHANAITTAMLATDAIKSTNYTASPNASSPYSATGTYLNLTNGNFYTPNFGIDNVHGEAYLNGEIIATSGSIGSNATNYWEIGNVQDYNMTDSAVIRGHGTAYIQSGYWQLSNDKLNTQYYDSSQSSGVLTYYNDSGTYYDVGQKIPTNFAAYNVNDTPVVKWNKAWFYGRKYTGDSVPSFDSDWTYFFEVDSNGNVTTAGDIYEGGVKLSDKYAAITDVGSAYLPKTGGTITGNLTVNGAFSTNVMLRTNLASTSAGQLTGNANATVTHGVTGTLGVRNGGTGQTTAQNAANAFITALPNWTATPTDDTYFIRRDTAGSATYGQVKFSTLWTYINNKISSTYDITNTYRRLDNNQFDTIDVTDIEAGNLIVTGAGRFTNGLYGNLIGNADTATTATTANKVANNLQILLNSGSTEGTNKFTYDGSSPKNINITKSSIGLGSVENTALSTWAGSANLTTTKVGTLAAAAAKGVDTSISAGSTSTNLPTSKAVATFVEGKGYVTTSGVTSITLKAGTGISLDTDNTAITSTGSRTISLANTYGDTINPYGNKTANYVLAGPSSGSATTPSFRALVAADIPSITKSKISDFPTTWALSNVTGADDLKAIEALTGTSGILKKTAANTWSLTTVISGLSINNDVITVTKSDGTTQDLTVNVTGQVVSGATILTSSSGQAISLGSASAPVYFSNGVPAQANTIPTVTLNGTATTSASFYAPTTAGTSGQILKSNGSGAPTWVNQNTLQVERATKDGDGNTISSTYLKLSGGTLTNPNNIFYNAGPGTVVTANAASVLQSPIPKYLWHDLWAFCKATTPKYYTTLDGTTWTEGTLEKRFFAHLEFWGQAEVIKSNGVIGSRWEWDGGRFAYCSGSWLVIGVAYANPIAKFDVLLEESADTGESGTWTTLCSSVGVSVNQSPVWIRTNGPSKNNIRLTITRNSESGTTTTLPIVSLRWLSYRWGDQGKGQEYEYPYTWDGDGNMTLKGNFTGTINTSNNTWNNIGDDIQIGDINKGGHLGIQGKNANTGIFFTTYGQTTKTVGGAITWDGSKFIITGTVDTSISGNAATATKATQDSNGNTITSTYVKKTGDTMTGALYITPASGEGGELHLNASTANTSQAGIALDQYNSTFRIFGIASSDGTTKTGTGTPLVIDPYAKTITGGYTLTGSLSGNATSATKATQDGNGDTISSTYAKLSGAAFTGAVTGTSFGASSYMTVNSGNSGTAGGLALWSTDPTAYGIMLRTTENQGKHGYVQGQYAAYLTMSGATASAAETRGWVFKNKMANECVASISALGHAVFNGSVTVGGNAENTSGCRMVVNESTNSLDFIWN